MGKILICFLLLFSNFVISMNEYKFFENLSNSRERKEASISSLCISNIQTDDQIVESIIAQYSEDKIIDSIKNLAKTHIHAVQYFPHMLELFCNKYKKDIDTALSEINGLLNICENLNLDASQMCQIFTEMLQAITEEDDISIFFESLDAFKFIYETDDFIQGKLLELITYINNDFTIEKYNIINILFPFIVNEELLKTKCFNNFNPYIFTFELLKVFSQRLEKKEDISELGHCFFYNFYQYEEEENIFQYTTRLIPQALETLISQYKTINQAVDIIIALLKKDYEMLEQLGEFMGFDPTLSLNETAYNKENLIIALLAKRVNRAGEVRYLFSVARKRINEIVCGNLEFERFVASVFQNLFLVLGSNKCDDHLKTIQAIKVAINILNDKIVPYRIVLYPEEEDRNDYLLEVFDDISSDNPPDDEDVASDIEDIISEREAIPVYAYDIIGRLLIKLKELNYKSSIQIFSGFYPNLEEIPAFLKESFIEPIAYQMFWLHKSFIMLGNLDDDLIIKTVQESDGRSDVLINKLREIIGE